MAWIQQKQRPTEAHQRPFGGVLELVTGWSGVGRPAAMVVLRSRRMGGSA
jgi:hypothetical protein